MTDSLSITDFITARLNEKHQLAEAATPGPWTALDGGVAALGEDDGEGGYPWPVSATESGRDREDRVHIAAHDPAAVVADIAAKRTILRLAAALRADGERAAQAITGDIPLEISGAILFGMIGAPGSIEKLLAAPFQSHPDFDPDWRIDG